MNGPASAREFLELVQKSGVVDESRLAAFLEMNPATGAKSPAALADHLVLDGLLTPYQAENLLEGRWRRFQIGKYTVLKRIGSGGMGNVFLCEHKLMRRRVAVKVLPTSLAQDPALLTRFYREARAVATLDHPNIVRAYDVDRDEDLHFLVMEYVEGPSLEELVGKEEPLPLGRAAGFIRQAATGLQHAHESAGIVHRDIKPANLIVDLSGVLKILDLGLAQYFAGGKEGPLGSGDDRAIGTADYLAPEQIVSRQVVDIRADIYSLGCTFYFCLAGKAPFAEGTVPQKLIWHETRQPRPIRSLRPDVPEVMAQVLARMLAKNPDDRFQHPVEVIQALEPWK